MSGIETWNECQDYCETAFASECNSVIYDIREQNCKVLKDSFSDYLPNCTAFGAGQDTPNNCLKDDNDYGDPCRFMLQSDCEFSGTVITGESGSDLPHCFELSEQLNGGYYYYDSETNHCTVYSNDDRKCNVQRSIKGASQNDSCQAEIGKSSLDCVSRTDFNKIAAP